MKNYRTYLVVALWLHFPSFLISAELKLTANGKPLAPIVIPREPAKSKVSANFSAAAQNLKEILHKVSGVAPEVLTLEQWSKRSSRGPAIYLGCGPASTEVADEEGSRIQTNDAGVSFTVCTKARVEIQENAMRYAVNTFAERDLGCRWLMPGALGESYPNHPDLTLTPGVIEVKPAFWFRRMRDRQTEGHEARRERALESLKTGDKDDAAFDFRQAEAGMGAGGWLRQMNMGRRFPFEFGHSFGGWWEKYGQTHPEYFALQPDGTRTQHPRRERLCESEPKLWDQVAANAIAAFDADPDLRMFSICENDGGSNTFCMCPKCMAMDRPDAPKISKSTSAAIYDPKTGLPFPNGYPSLSDRVFTFFNEVAKRVKEKYPDRYLGTYAYSFYRTVPVDIEKLEDNIIVSLVSDDSDLVEAWSKLAPKMFVRPNTLSDSRAFGIVRNDAHRLGKLMQTAAQHHVLGFDWDGMIGNWATQGLNYYVVAKMVWDPTQDVDALIDDYLIAAYGKAAQPSMRRYYDSLEKVTGEMMSDEDYSGRKPVPTPLLKHYTAAAFNDFDQCLAEGRGATAENSPERRRIELLSLGLEYSKRVCGLISRIGTSPSKKTYQTEWQKDAPFFAELAKNPYFGVSQDLTKLTPALSKLSKK